MMSIALMKMMIKLPDRITVNDTRDTSQVPSADEDSTQMNEEQCANDNVEVNDKQENDVKVPDVSNELGTIYIDGNRPSARVNPVLESYYISISKSCKPYG